ncbi:MAG: transcriptional regulator [Cyclobacteriaceae bacterium]|nr:transcriptional regulator [Cyclobacteriaceae bacterium]
MKNPFDHLDKVLEHSIRLRIMVVLAANPSYDYSGMKDLLEVTDGNLATHLKTLEREKYLLVTKSFVDRKPNTRYRITDRGRSALKRHMEAMAEVVRQSKHPQ